MSTIYNMYYKKRESLTNENCSNCAFNCAYCMVGHDCEDKSICDNYDAMRMCNSCVKENKFTSFYAKVEKAQPVQTVYVSTVDPDFIPKKQYNSDSGFDLYAAEDSFIYPNKFKAIGTGVKIGIPPGFEGQIRPRSGLAAKKGVTVLNTPGTIDQDYRGEVMVILINHGDCTFFAEKGDRIAQLVIKPVYNFEFKKVFKLSVTDRGDDGFGSTGV